MPGPLLPFALPEVLSGAAAGTGLVDVGTVWDVGLDGQGYMLSTLDQESPFEFRSYAVQAIQKQKPRVDQSEEPGEQTLEPWWTRAQHSWHAGAGQAVFDSEFSTRFGYRQSFGIDTLSVKGQLTLLKETSQLDTNSAGDYHLHSHDGDLFMSEDGIIFKIPDLDDHPGSSASDDIGGPGVGSGTVKSITCDGKYLYVCWGGSSGIRRIDMAVFTTDQLVNDLDPTVIEFVKNRLMAAKGQSIYEIIDVTDTTEPSAIFTHSSEDWIWSAFAEAGPAIYVSGYADDRSDIYGIRLTVDDLASGATLGAPVSRWQAPAGEKIFAILGFSGLALLIGTSRGLRIGVISTDEGDLNISPLLTEHEEPIHGFALDGDYAYFSWGHFDSTFSGIGRVDLGERFYSSDVMYSDEATVKDIAVVGGRKVFVLETDSGNDEVAVESATVLVSQGYVETGELRFGTFEGKIIRFLDILGLGSGSLDVDKKLDQSTNYSALLVDLTPGNIAERLDGEEATRFEYKIKLSRDSGDTTLGPTILEWRFRAEPLASGRFRYYVPLMIYDFVETKSGRVGGLGYAATKLQELMLLYRQSGRVFVYQGPDVQVPGGSEPVNVTVEEMRYQEYALPTIDQRGFGGICLMVLREQE